MQEHLKKALCDRPELQQALQKAARPRCLSLEGDVRFEPDGVSVCGIRVLGESLKTHIEGCTRVIVFAATLGAEVDRLISRCSSVSLADGYIVDTLASEYIERYCDDMQAVLAKRDDGLFLRPRFSPGYGDVDMMLTEQMLTLLDANKRIGLCCTDAGMMTPVKSVSAFIGLTDQAQSCHVHKCAACPNRDCAFRKEI